MDIETEIKPSITKNIQKNKDYDKVLKLIIAISSVLTFLTLLVAVIIVVPKAVNLMNTAQWIISKMYQRI